MRVLFYFSHPAQFHFSKHAIEELKKKNHRVDILAKTKDVLTQLLDEKGWQYTNIQMKERGRSRLSIMLGLLKRDLKLFAYCFKRKHNLLIGTDACLAHIGFVLKIPVITILEDDFKVIKTLARLTFPFTSYILAPNVCQVGKWKNKKIGYDGYMKLAYLHPYRFIQTNEKFEFLNYKPFYLIRLSGLNAHHDFGITGISEKYLEIIIENLQSKGKIFISFEKQLPEKFKKYLLKIPASQLHHFLHNAEMLISDSQSMTVEAAMLGIPSVRISSFSGKISVLEELENKYQLTYSFLPEEIVQAIQKINQLLLTPGLKEEIRSRRNRMLGDKIDVTGFFVWLLEHFPKSIKILSENPEYQKQFIANEIAKEMTVPAAI